MNRYCCERGESQFVEEEEEYRASDAILIDGDDEVQDADEEDVEEDEEEVEEAEEEVEEVEEDEEDVEEDEENMEEDDVEGSSLYHHEDLFDDEEEFT